MSSKNIKGAQEKRVIYDSLSFSVDSSQEDSLGHPDRLVYDSPPSSTDVVGPSGRTAAAIAKSKAYSKVGFSEGWVIGRLCSVIVALP